jgi:hypothetical protein
VGLLSAVVEGEVGVAFAPGGEDLRALGAVEARWCFRWLEVEVFGSVESRAPVRARRGGLSLVTTGRRRRNLLGRFFFYLFV